MIVHSNGGGGGWGAGREFLKVPDYQKIKSYENILGKLQNTCKNEKENKKPSFCSKSG